MIPETKIGSACAKMLLNGGLMFIVATLLFPGEILGNKIENEINYRLPNYIIPLHYSIKLQPLVSDTEQSFFFIGSCSITLFISYSTWNITFHLDKAIEVRTTVIDDYFNGAHLPVASYNATKKTMTLYFTHELSPGIYILKIFFSAIAYNNYAFFTIICKNIKNYIQSMTVTNFQRIGARQVFPCWDEPAMKASFTINVIHEFKYTGWSNMPPQKIMKIKDLMWTTFYTTPPISPYRIGILLIENHFTNIIDYENITIHYRKEIKTNIKFAKMIIRKVTKYLQSKWKITEMVPKVDHIIIPSLIDNGIQNWGLVCHNEADVIYNHTLDSPGRDKEVARLIARQVASQWFNNLVSPSWWSDEWLNEGLTMFLGMDAVDKLFPNYQMMDLFVVQNRDLLNLDLYIKRKPFTSKINSPSDINSLSFFPYYLKASAFLRTLQHVISKKVFQEGIDIYLNTYKFSSATSDDFWTAMQAALNKSHHAYKFDLKEKLLNYMWNYASILVNVNRDYVTGYTYVSINYHCELSGKDFKIPVTYTTQNNNNFNITSPTNIIWKNYWDGYQQSLPLMFHSNDTNGWLILNLQQIGYYRVNYDLTNWQRIVEYLNTKEYTKIHVLNRAQLIDDIFHFMRTPNECYFMKCDEIHAHYATLFLRFLSYLSQETNFIAWYPMFKAFEYLSHAFPLSQMTNIKEKMRRTLNSVIDMIGYDDPEDDHSDNYFYNYDIILRHEVLRWSCVLNDIKCKKVAHKKLQLHFLATEPSTPNISWPVPGLKEWAICNGLTIAKSDIWHKVLNMWQQTSDNKLLEFLACTENSDIVKKYLNLTSCGSNEYFIKATDRIRGFYFIIAKNINNNIVLNYILKNFDTIIPREVGETSALIFIINHLHDYLQLDTVLFFVQKNLNHLSAMVLNKKLSRMKCMIRFESRMEKTKLIKLSNN